ncbi:glycosyltransferase family 39 protein [Cryomorphaceae bacterium 1068]|nr:glycosyltransferase family 39 protein [Cryomorphaceae bacterium 1068]
MDGKKLLRDIRFWIVFFFLIRLFGITNPPLEVGHNWRQTTVTMVARNFLEVDNSIFYPRIDIAGEKTGITGMEFPVLNYLIYCVSEVFVYQHWYGRLINLIISSLGLWFFYRLLRKYFPENVSFYSTIILAVSVWFQFSRKIMPDTFSMSMILACIYYGTNYLENKKNQAIQLVVYFSLLVLGMLSKLPAGYILIVFAIPFLDKDIDLKKKLVFALASFVGLIPVVAWYYYWVPHLVEAYGFWHFFMGSSISQGFSEILENGGQTVSRFYDTAMKYVGFAAFLLGLIISIAKKEWRIYTLFALGFSGFLLVVFKAGFTFSHHNYYIIPFVPIMALVAGYGLSQIESQKIAVFLLVAICAEGIANQHQDFRIKERSAKILNLESDLDQFSERSDLILINSGYYPTPMYFAHRKGWVNTNEQIQVKEYLEDLQSKGLKYIVILKRAFGKEMELNDHEVVFDNEDYRIYKLKEYEEQGK